MANDVALARIDRVTAMLAEAQTLTEVKHVIALADAARAYAKQVGATRETINYTTEIRLRADRKLGEMLRDMPQANPGRPRKISPTVGPISKRTQVADAGISHRLCDRAETIAGIPSEMFENAIKASPGAELYHNNVYNHLRKLLHKDAQAEKYAEASDVSMDDCRVICGDFADIAESIPGDSVDAIITDPPYPQEFSPLFQPLAVMAKRVLKPGGSLVVMCGQSYLPLIIETLGDVLTYQWTLAYLTPGAATQMYQRNVNTSWKPVLWFVKGEYSGGWIQDVAKSDQRDKEFHEWGQSESGTAALVERFSEPGDLVMDPFTGGGTTGIAALSLKRRFIGMEIDPDTARIAHGRIAEALNGTSESKTD